MDCSGNLDRGITKPIAKLQNTFYDTTVNLPECCVQCIAIDRAVDKASYGSRIKTIVVSQYIFDGTWEHKSVLALVVSKWRNHPTNNESNSYQVLRRRNMSLA